MFENHLNDLLWLINQLNEIDIPGLIKPSSTKRALNQSIKPCQNGVHTKINGIFRAFACLDQRKRFHQLIKVPKPPGITT